MLFFYGGHLVMRSAKLGNHLKLTKRDGSKKNYFLPFLYLFFQ